MLVLAGATASAFAGDKGARKEIEAQYRLYAQALINKDVPTMFTIMTADGSFWEGPKGPTNTRSGLEKMMRGMLKTTTFEHVNPRIRRFRVDQNTATVDISNLQTGKMAGKGGVIHTFEYLSKSTDTWVKTPKGWRLKLITATGEYMKQDGKLIYSLPAPAKKP